MSDGVEILRGALADHDAWLVGGAVRDRLLDHPAGGQPDLDVVVSAADAEGPARAVARAAGRGAAVFRLNDAFGAWRVVAPGGAWQADLSALQGGSIDHDLRARDLTINAMAEPLGGGEIVDPTGGRADLDARVARAPSDRAFADDPLRCLRVARFATELGLRVDGATRDQARAKAAGLHGVAGERVFAELRRIVAAPAVLRGIALLDELELTEHVLPEITALRGVPQNRYHHADVHGHTLEVLEQAVALQADPGRHLGAEHAGAISAVLAEPLSDELTRGDGLRLGALLHDVAKPQTRRAAPGGITLGFPGHDVEGERVTREILTRLRTSERLRAHVGALARHHLALGFLTRHQPLPRRALFHYLTSTEPVEVDVTLLSVADRLATRGRKADEAIARHLALARDVIGEALRWRAGETRPQPLLRGDELADELGLAPGPQLGGLLRELAAAQFAGEVATRREAVVAAREVLARG